jgi:TRAP-type C4-dicarboxylate transport system permease small subunit
MISLIEFFRERLKGTVIACLVLVGVIALWGGFMVDTSHAHTKMEKIPFFWSAFGLIGGALLIVLSRFLGRLGIMTREDYYDE